MRKDGEKRRRDGENRRKDNFTMKKGLNKDKVRPIARPHPSPLQEDHHLGLHRPPEVQHQYPQVTICSIIIEYNYCCYYGLKYKEIKWGEVTRVVQVR